MRTVEVRFAPVATMAIVDGSGGSGDGGDGGNGSGGLDR